MNICPCPIDSDAAQSGLLQLSLSEISALSWRAFRGAGRAWGEAEEGAEATCWLARAGLDWAEALIVLLSSPVLDERHSSMLCPLRAGLMLSDFAGLPEGLGPGAAHFRIMCAPAFLLPFIAQVTVRTGQGLRMEWNSAHAVLAPGAAPFLKWNIDATGPALVAITPLSSAPQPQTAWPPAHHASLTPFQYETLSTIALKFTVPTSSSSQAGAGAQGGDND